MPKLLPVYPIRHTSYLFHRPFQRRNRKNQGVDAISRLSQAVWRTAWTPYLLNDLLFVKWLNWTTILFKNLTYGYIISRILATGIGLILNYIFRKKFIFK